MCSFSSGYRPFTIYWFRWYLEPRHWIAPVKHFWQRGTRGYADCDVWNLDGYLARVISESVDQLKETSRGLIQQKGKQALTDISDGFKNYLETQHGTKPLDKKKFNKSFRLFKEYFSSLWD